MKSSIMSFYKYEVTITRVTYNLGFSLALGEQLIYHVEVLANFLNIKGQVF